VERRPAQHRGGAGLSRVDRIHYILGHRVYERSAGSARHDGQTHPFAVRNDRFVIRIVHRAYRDSVSNAHVPQCFAVVLTTVWVELVGDPNLFRLRHVPSRDHRILEILFFFMGAVLGRALLDQIGSAGTLGIGTAIRFLVALLWLAVPEKPVGEQ